MDKVKVTQEQAEAIERALEVSEREQFVVEHIEYIQEGNGWKMGVFKPLNDLSVESLIIALYIGYEVEPEWKEGDWYFDENNSKLEEATSLAARNLNEFPDTFKHIRPATPSEIAEEKERRWWKKHNRDVWELKKGDIVFSVRSNDVIQVIHSTEMAESLRDNYKIVCFAEDRLDVKK